MIRIPVNTTSISRKVRNQLFFSRLMTDLCIVSIHQFRQILFSTLVLFLLFHLFKDCLQGFLTVEFVDSKSKNNLLSIYMRMVSMTFDKRSWKPDSKHENCTLSPFLVLWRWLSFPQGGIREFSGGYIIKTPTWVNTQRSSAGDDDRFGVEEGWWCELPICRWPVQLTLPETNAWK